MIILAVDTTTFSGSVALLDDTNLVAELNMDSAKTYSERLLPSINFLLEANDLSIKDVEAYAVAAGPGSFTGIRIGLSTVKSLAYASSGPVASVSTLEALALKLAHPHRGLVCPVVDAKKKEVYAALFELQKGRLKEIVPQGNYKSGHFLSLLPTHRIISFIGNGTLVYRGKIIDYLRDKARFPARSCFIAHEVGLLGYELLRQGKGVSFEALKPMYFRKSQAEEND